MYIEFQDTNSDQHEQLLYNKMHPCVIFSSYGPILVTRFFYNTFTIHYSAPVTHQYGNNYTWV